jgi:hypothetical protein
LPENNSDLCYRITVKHQDNTDSLCVLVDKAGNAKISGNKLILDVDTFDYSSCKNVVSSK